jgi:hypothetical protein
MIWTALSLVGGFLKRMPWQVWAAAAVVLTVWLWGNHRYSQGVHHERAQWEAAQAAAVELGRKADVVAADQRAADTITNTEAAKGRTDAILANPVDPYRALACQRLRSRPGFDPVATGCGR